MSSPAPDDDFLQSFSILLMVYSKIKKTSAKGKTTSKEEKSTKMKELLFSPTDSNYIEFSQAVLHKHGLNDYQVSEKKHFPLKYIPPKARGQRISDAIDVDNLADYREMVKKISEGQLPISKGSRSSNDDDSEPTSDSAKRTSRKADLDSRLARWRLKLQKAYKNEGDKGLMYFGPQGPIPLTPAMVHDWCLALEDGQVTIATPPNIESFNSANKVPFLHPAHKAAAQPAAPAATDLNSLTSAILLRTLTQLDTGLIHSPTSPTSTPPAPQTPVRHQVHTMSSPPIPSPSQVVCYLEYAETNLGVRHALSYKSAFELHGIGPDILPNIDDKFLAGLGLSAGDAIHLKRGSIAWWNSPDAKRKRSDASTSEPASKRNHSSASETQMPKKVSYEKQYHEGGGNRFTGPPMKKDEDDDGFPPDRDYDLFYFCETFKEWFPVPSGYIVDDSGKDIADEA
ncbi:hypothetical protein PISMIDRAFT_16437 [Pisolithus microcarpus 441]|uniref:Uncharacterized protein n=1 Tax=Pisolithus microcarpus 441 TaxID=765257 RepID=A0A0C9XTA6_9AGAM|nr:hypothetical protein PISMIDRAFT_16437 [Pisolithus microcarpus 441]